LLGLSYNDPHTGEPYDGAADRYHHPRIFTFADLALYDPLPPSWSKDRLSLHTGGGRFVLSVPLPLSAYSRSSVPGEGDISFWRIAIMWKRGDPLPPKRPTIEYVESQISLIQDNPAVRIAALLNGSRYRVRNAIAEAMYKPLGQGHVLLAGDSGHAFSPTGGQGAHFIYNPCFPSSNRELRTICKIRHEPWLSGRTRNESSHLRPYEVP